MVVSHVPKHVPEVSFQTRLVSHTRPSVARPLRPSSTPNKITRLLRDGISNRAQMRSRYNRKNTRIDHPQIIRPIDGQIRVNHTSKMQRHHRTGARIVILRPHAVLQDRIQIVRARVSGDRAIARHQLLDRRCIKNALVELHGCDHELAVEGVDEPAGVDHGGLEGVRGRDMDGAAGEGMLG